MLRAEGLGNWRSKKFSDFEDQINFNLRIDLALVKLKLSCSGDGGKDCAQIALDQESSGDQVC